MLISRQLDRMKIPSFRQWAILASASGIASNAVDMTKWMNFHLNGGRNDRNVRVMDPTLVDMLHAPRVKLPHSSTSWQPGTSDRFMEDTYAYGWKNGHYRGKVGKRESVNNGHNIRM